MELKDAYNKIDNFCCSNHNSLQGNTVRYLNGKEEKINMFADYQETKDNDFCKDVNEMVEALETIKELIDLQDDLGCPLKALIKAIKDGRLITAVYVPLYKDKEEYEKLVQTIKDHLKEKLYIPADYSNPGPTINEIYLPKKYLKWEDLKFSYGEWNKIEVYQGNEKLGISYKSDFDFFDNSYEVVKIYNLKTKSHICKIYDKDKQFFNNLHLEVIENE